MLATLQSWFDRTVEWLGLATLVALTAVIVLGVAMREMGDPLIWTDEASRFLMIWLAALGWIMASRRGAHIRIRFFHDMMPRALWKGAELAMQGAVVAFGVGIAWFSVDLVTRNQDMEATTLPISISWMYVPMVLAGLATVGQGLMDMAAALAGPPVVSPNADVAAESTI